MFGKLRASLSGNTTYWGAGLAAVTAATLGATLLLRHPINWPGAQLPPAVSRGENPMVATPAPALTVAAAPADGPTAAPELSPSAPAVQRPAFDIVRVEPTGDAVIAGHAAPKATIELRDDGRVVAQASADASGDFTMLPPPFSAGEHRLELAARTGEAPAVLSDSAVINVPVQAIKASAAPAAHRADALAIPRAPPASTPGSASPKPDAASARAGATGSILPAGAARVLMRTYRATDTGRRDGLSAAAPAMAPKPAPEPMPEGDARPVHAGGHR
jgi:hypothetical protein